MTQRRLAVGALVSFAIFLIVGILVKLSPGLNDADLSATLWVNNLSVGAAIDSFLVASSLYGREYFWVAVVAFLFLAGDRRTKIVALGLSGVFIVGIVAGEAAKEIFARQRPWEYLSHVLVSSGAPTLIQRLPSETDFSFPSGHAVIVSAGAAYAMATFRNRWLAGLLTLEAGLVCISRVYVGAHYPTDVLAGVALGSAVAFGGLYLGKRYFLASFQGVADIIAKVLRDGPVKA